MHSTVWYMLHAAVALRHLHALHAWVWCAACCCRSGRADPGRHPRRGCKGGSGNRNGCACRKEEEVPKVGRGCFDLIFASLCEGMFSVSCLRPGHLRLRVEHQRNEQCTAAAADGNCLSHPTAQLCSLCVCVCVWWGVGLAFRCIFTCSLFLVLLSLGLTIWWSAAS